MKNEKETCCYRNIDYCDFDGRGRMYRQGKESSNRIGNRIRNNFYFLINQNVSKLQIILMSLSFKAKKKGKKNKKRNEKMIYSGRTYDVIY